MKAFWTVHIEPFRPSSYSFSDRPAWTLEALQFLILGPSTLSLFLPLNLTKIDRSVWHPWTVYLIVDPSLFETLRNIRISFFQQTSILTRAVKKSSPRNSPPFYISEKSPEISSKWVIILTQKLDMKGGARNEFHCGIDDPISVGRISISPHSIWINFVSLNREWITHLLNVLILFDQITLFRRRHAVKHLWFTA